MADEDITIYLSDSPTLSLFLFLSWLLSQFASPLLLRKQGFFVFFYERS